jgi:hypothetical protein
MLYQGFGFGCPTHAKRLGTNWLDCSILYRMTNDG